MKSKINYIFILIAIAISSFPFFIFGYTKGHDWVYEINRVIEYKNALDNNQFPPFWAENLYEGKGSPIFLYYAPLFTFITSLFSYFTSSFYTSSIITLTVFSLIGAIGIRLLLRELLGVKNFISDSASRISIYVFIFNPYLNYDKFIRNASAEYIALCLAPLTIYGLILIRSSPLAGFLSLSGAFSLVIIAHNLTALTIAAVLVCLCLITYLKNNDLKYKSYAISALILGLLISSFFWVPALYYKPLVQTNLLTVGKFNFHNNFIFIENIFFNFKHYSLGILNFYIIVRSLTLIIKPTTLTENKIKYALFLGFIFTLFFIFIQTEFSIFLWENIPLLNLYQFPSRFMGPLSLTISIMAGLIFYIKFKNKPKEFIFKSEIIIIIICIFNTLPQLPLIKKMHESQQFVNDICANDKDNYNKHCTATVLDEYMPVLDGKNESTIHELILNIDDFNKNELSLIKWNATNIILDIKRNSVSKLKINRWFFPGWKCTVNNKQCEIEKSPLGLILITIPSGSSHIHLTLSPPIIRKVFCYVSFVFLSFWLFLIVILFRKYHFIERDLVSIDNQT